MERKVAAAAYGAGPLVRVAHRPGRVRYAARNERGRSVAPCLGTAVPLESVQVAALGSEQSVMYRVR